MSAKDRYNIYRRGEDKPICVGLTVLEALHFRLTFGGQNYSFEAGADKWGRPCLKLWINGSLTQYTTRQVGEGVGGRQARHRAQGPERALRHVFKKRPLRDRRQAAGRARDTP
jgi:hypothetical protein